MRVLISFVSPTPNRLTGLSAYTFALIEALGAYGRHDYVLATNWHPEHVPAGARAALSGIVARVVPANETRALLTNRLTLPGIARDQRCAVTLHTTPTASLGGMRRSAVVVHDLYRVTNPEMFGWRQRFQWNGPIAASLRRAGALIAVSGATRDALVAAYPAVAARTHVVQEAAVLRPQAPVTPYRTPDGAPYGLMVANITPNKNVPLLIDALARLAATGRRPRMLIVGRDECGALAGLPADIDLVSLGQVDDATLATLYAGARAYINTSRVEGFCLPVLEAQGFGVPVICSDIPVLREVAGDGAIFVADAAGLAAAITSLFDDGVLHERMATRAAANARRFSWQRAAQETEVVLQTIAGGVPRLQ